jgi:hypothetical protein
MVYLICVWSSIALTDICCIGKAGDGGASVVWDGELSPYSSKRHPCHFDPFERVVELLMCQAP